MFSYLLPQWHRESNESILCGLKPQRFPVQRDQNLFEPCLWTSFPDENLHDDGYLSPCLSKLGSGILLCLVSLLEKPPLAFIRHDIMLSFMNWSYEISRNKELNIGDRGWCETGSWWPGFRWWQKGAHPPGLFLVWTATGPLELFWKQLEMESIAVCGDTKKYMFWAGK